MVKRDNATFSNPSAFVLDPEDFNPDAVTRPNKIEIVVRRDFLYEDAFNDLSPQNGKPKIYNYLSECFKLCVAFSPGVALATKSGVCQYCRRWGAGLRPRSYTRVFTTNCKSWF